MYISLLTPTSWRRCAAQPVPVARSVANTLNNWSWTCNKKRAGINRKHRDNSKERPNLKVTVLGYNNWINKVNSHFFNMPFFLDKQDWRKKTHCSLSDWTMFSIRTVLHRSSNQSKTPDRVWPSLLLVLVLNLKIFPRALASFLLFTRYNTLNYNSLLMYEHYIITGFIRALQCFVLHKSP